MSVDSLMPRSLLGHQLLLLCFFGKGLLLTPLVKFRVCLF
jgi:hypothetical protein